MAKYPYPVSEAKWGDCDRIMTELNNRTYSYMSIVECDIIYTNRNIVCAIVPEKQEVRLQYNCNDKNNLVISSVDLEDAIKSNHVKITKIHNAVEWVEKEYIFKDAVENLFNERLKAKAEGDDALSGLLKLIMNSGYGKFEQKMIDTETKICDNNEQMEKKPFLMEL